MNLLHANVIRAMVLAGLLLVSGAGQAAGPAISPAVVQIQDRWAQISYQTPKAQRAAAFEALAKQAAQVHQAQPQDAATLIWEGIVLSSWAGEKGGVGALSLVKQARADLEAALKLDPGALSGSAYTSLGALYYQVPGWPLGFGNDQTARQMLRKGLEISPDGIDANYFYGDFLRDQKDWAGAIAAFQKALAAPARPGREVADAGRRHEIEGKLKEVSSHLASR
jgi:tetratricopeptide (TPR) repeat protein